MDESKDLFSRLNFSQLRESISDDRDLLLHYSYAKKNLQDRNPDRTISQKMIFEEMLNILFKKRTSIKERTMYQKLRILMIHAEKDEYAEKTKSIKIDLKDVDFYSLHNSLTSSGLNSKLYKIYSDAKEICLNEKKSPKKIEILEKVNEILNQEINTESGKSLMTQFRVLLEKNRI